MEAKRREIDQLSQTVKELRDAAKDQAAEFERKRNEISDKASFFESEARRYKEENTRIYDTLKAKINETISTVGNRRGP